MRTSLSFFHLSVSSVVLEMFKSPSGRPRQEHAYKFDLHLVSGIIIYSRTLLPALLRLLPAFVPSMIYIQIG
jgi:hypothetical protein